MTMKLVITWSIVIVVALAGCLVGGSPASLTYEKCGFYSDENFHTWFDSQYLFTNSPVLFPKNDDEIRNIVTTAKANGCKVRVRGAGHSKDGVVMQKLDELEDFETIVINLKDYTPDDSQWDAVLDPSTPSIKISAGASIVEMLSIVRPVGYLPTTVMDGRYFSVGGAYLNPSCHGATIEESRLAAQVLSFRVMDADGVITDYTDIESVKEFRGSMGLLGIVTAVEVKLVQDNSFEMTLDQIAVSGYTDADLRSLFESKYTEFDGIQFQWFAYTDTLITLENNFNAGDPIDTVAVQAYYDGELAKYPDLSYDGGNMSDLVELVKLLSDWITGSRFLSEAVSTLTMQLTIDGFNDVSSLSRDGAYVPNDQAPNINLAHLFIPCETDCVDETVDLFKQSRDFAKDIIDGFSDWYPTLPLDWRVITVQSDEMLLENLSPGKWLSWEYFTLSVDGDTTENNYLKQLEDMWRNSYPDAQVHLGKTYAYGSVAGVGKFPFQDDSVLDNIYTQAVKENFKASMDKYDPSGTFRAGSVLRLLGETSSKYTPKQYIGDSCEADEDAECINGCCDFQWNIFVEDTCQRNDKSKNERCGRSCECASNKCRWKLFKGFVCK